MPQAGDALWFSIVSGSVPEGLNFDPSDGTLSGVPTAFGVSPVPLTLRITHAGASFTTVQVTVSLASAPVPLTLAYGPCCTSITSEAVALPATSTYRRVIGASMSFVFSGEAPTVLTADQSTGTLQGTLTRADTFVFTVTQTIYLPDGSTVMANSAPLTWVVIGIVLNYEVFTYNIFPDAAFSIDPPVIGGGRETLVVSS